MFGFLFFLVMAHGAYQPKGGINKTILGKKKKDQIQDHLASCWWSGFVNWRFKHFHQLILICRCFTHTKKKTFQRGGYIKNPIRHPRRQQNVLFLFLTAAVSHQLRWKSIHLIRNQSNWIHLICATSVYESLALPTFLVCLFWLLQLCHCLIFYLCIDLANF